MLCTKGDPTPPIWPDAFSVGSREYMYKIVNDTRVPIGVNDAYWYYDWTNKRMRFDHDEGQEDNFCWMEIKEPVACQLIFDPSGVMFVNYPTKDYCCQICPKGAYCTVIKPTWLSGATYDGMWSLITCYRDNQQKH